MSVLQWKIRHPSAHFDLRQIICLPKRRKTIREFLTPTPKKDLCRFLEVGKYCNDFYPDLVWIQSMHQKYKQNAPNEIGKILMRKLSRDCRNL